MAYKDWIKTKEGKKWLKKRSKYMKQNNPMKNRKTVEKRLANIDYKTIAEKISNTRLQKFKTGELKISKETRRKISLATKGKKDFKKNKTYEECFGYEKSKEIKQKISMSNKGKRRTEQTKQKISKYRQKNPQKNFKQNNGNWNGGLKKLKYTHCNKEWKEMRKKLLQKYNNTCQKCGTTEDLVIHHKDYDITNNDESNLVIICRKCNSSINHGRYEYDFN